jgi:hypothetical protein
VEQITNIIAAIALITIGFMLANYLTNLFRKTVAPKASDPLVANFWPKLSM